MAMAATLEAPTVGALDRLDQALEIVRAVVAEVDPDTVTGDDASLILERLVKIDRAVAAGRLGFARRSAQCMTWRQEGHRSAEDWLAQKTKSSVAEACAALKTAKALPDLPSTLDALRQGTLSLPQVREIATAATADPSSEKELIEAAGYLTLKGLQHRAGLVRAAAVDEAKRVAGLHRGRLFRNWLDPEGGFNLRARLTPDDGAQVLAMVRMRAEFVADEARVAGLAPESQAAYEADALVALVTGDYRRATFKGQVGGRQRSAEVVYHVNLESLRRGRLEAGEVCEVPGVGLVPLATIENVVGDAMAKLVIGNSVDVTTVCHLGRTVPAHVETALEARDRACVVPGCDVTLSLEIDHWKVPFAAGGPTALWNLARICHFHHQLKTYEGYRLRGGPGGWEWVAPADARHGPEDEETGPPGPGP